MARTIILIPKRQLSFRGLKSLVNGHNQKVATPAGAGTPIHLQSPCMSYHRPRGDMAGQREGRRRERKTRGHHRGETPPPPPPPRNSGRCGARGQWNRQRWAIERTGNGLLVNEFLLICSFQGTRTCSWATEFFQCFVCVISMLLYTCVFLKLQAVLKGQSFIQHIHCLKQFHGFMRNKPYVGGGV